MNTEVKVTRRAVLGAGLGLAGIALIAGSGGFGSLLRLGVLDPLAEASYRPLVGSNFQVGSGGTVLKLVGVRNLGPLSFGRTLMTGKEHFALDFEGPAGNRLASAQHPLSHPDLGQFQLFLTPVGRTSSIQGYEAIVNRFEINTGRKIDV
jgi:hypothetical protein